MPATITSNVTPTLSGLAGLIRQDLTAIDKNREDWVNRTMSLALHLKEARETHSGDNNAFGKWLDENTKDAKKKLSKDDRAALLSMAQDPERSRKMLEKTSRTSYQHIWKQEGGVGGGPRSTTANVVGSLKAVGAKGKTGNGKPAPVAQVTKAGKAKPAPAVKKATRETLLAEVSAYSKGKPREAFIDMVAVLADQGLQKSVTPFMLTEALAKLAKTWEPKVNAAAKPVLALPAPAPTPAPAPAPSPEPAAVATA
jgi:hypothetical protein